MAPSTPNDTAPIPVWNSQAILSAAGLLMVVATRDVVTNTQAAVNCTTYNATYHALITHTNTSSSVVDVYQTDVHEQFTSTVNSTLGSQSPEGYARMQYDAIITAFSDVLAGTVTYIPVYRSTTITTTALLLTVPFSLAKRTPRTSRGLRP